MTQLSALQNLPSFQVPYIFQPIQKLGCNVYNSAVGIISPKHTVKPDSIFQSAVEIIPHIKHSLAGQVWKIFSIFRSTLISGPDHLENHIKALTMIHRQSENKAANEIAFQNQDQQANLRDFISKMFADPSLLDQIHDRLSATNQSEFLRTLDICKIIVRIHDNKEGNIYDSIVGKMEKIKQAVESGTDIEDSFKLNAQEYGALLFASEGKNILSAMDILSHLGELNLDKSRFETLERLFKGPVIQQVREECREIYQSGRIFLYDRIQRIETLDQRLDFDDSMRHLLIFGRLCHTGFFVKDQAGKINISHTGSVTHSHQIFPMRDPLRMAFFSHLIELDVTSLIPSGVSENDKQILKTTFSSAIENLASQEHREVPLAEWKSYIKTFFMGHLSPFSHKLEDAKFVAGHPQMCSSYVAIIFLQAIQQVNAKLKELGYKEQIDHPFGQHEILDRIDILRLIYLLKGLRVYKTVTVKPLVAKVMALPKFHVLEDKGIAA